MRVPRSSPYGSLLAAVAVAGTALVVLGAGPGHADTPAPTAAFSPPVALTDATGASTLAAEPTIAVDSHDNVYVTGPAGVPTGGCPFWRIQPDRQGSSVADYRGTVDTDHNSVGGGDCDISTLPVPAAQADDLSVTSLSLANLTSNVTYDGGATWPEPAANPVSQQVFAVDRQWQASDPALGRHYLLVHDNATDNIQVSVATDGGYQYVQNLPAISPTLYPAARSNHYGKPVVDPNTHRIYVPFLAPAAGDAPLSPQHVVYVAEGDPCALAPCTPGQPVGPITWTDHVVYTGAADANLANIFPAIAIDAAGRLYVVWTGDITSVATGKTGDDSANDVFLAHSLADASSWSAPVAVDGGGYRSNMFPWVVAGGAGQVGVAWYGGTLDPMAVPKDCAKRTGSPDDSNGVNNNCWSDWVVAYAQSGDGGTTFTQSTASPVVHQGSVCDIGTSCLAFNGDRTLLDFFSVALDSSGRPNIAYATDIGSPGTANLAYTRQCAGSSLTGAALSGACGALGTPAACSADAAYTAPSGDATQFVVNSTPLPSDDGLDIVGGHLATTLLGVSLTVDIKNLAADTVGQIVEQHFTLRGTPYYVFAQRATGTGAISYSYGTTDPTTGTRKKLGGTTGTFDNATNTVSTVFPADAVTPPVTAGDVVSGLVVTTRRDFVEVIPNADSAGDPCSYTVGTGIASPAGPSATTSPTGSPTPSATGSASPSPSASVTAPPTTAPPTTAPPSTPPSTTAPPSTPPSTTAPPSAAPPTTAPPTTAPPTSAAPAGQPSPTGSPTTGAAAPCRQPELSVVDPEITAGDGARVRFTGNPGESMSIEAYSRPDTTYRTVRTAVTVPANGVVDEVFHPGTNTRLRAVTGDCGLSPSVVIEVDPGLSLSVRRIGTGRYVFSGSVLPARQTEGLTLALAYLDQGRVVVKAHTTVHDGRFRLPVGFTGRGTFPFVMVSGQTMTSGSGTSNGVSVTIS